MIKVIDHKELGSLREKYPHRKIVHCHGVYDILHAGHLAYFSSAKKHGDILVVTVTPDRFVNKGPGRPYFTEKVRANMLAALELIDFVSVSDSPTAVQSIQTLRPNVYAKGPDYKDKSKDVTGEIYNEENAVTEVGGAIVFTEDETFSSSNIINRFFAGWSDQQKAQIERINAIGGYGEIAKAIDGLSNLSISIVGEPITDVYRFCSPEGLSSKSPTISARMKFEERYDGGALAIYNHLKSFSDKVSICLGCAGKVPEKVRYISLDRQQRVFEVTTIDEESWDQDYAIDYLRDRSGKTDVVIAADFGHGLFDKRLLSAMDGVRAFVGLNVQTNSSNFGFNLYKKHSRFDYLCLDTREARLGCHDKLSSSKELCALVKHDISNRYLSMTLGPGGSYLSAKEKEYLCPSFADVVVDATGAGDAYFAITSALLAAGASPELIPFIGNVYAGLKTKIVGNKSAVSKPELLKAISSILR